MFLSRRQQADRSLILIIGRLGFWLSRKHIVRDLFSRLRRATVTTTIPEAPLQLSTPWDCHQLPEGHQPDQFDTDRDTPLQSLEVDRGEVLTLYGPHTNI